MTWQVLRPSCWVPLRVLLYSTDGILKWTFSTVILSCRRDQLRHFNSVNSSLTYVFHLVDFVDISYLTHFAITNVVTFTKLCILLYYEVFVLKFRKRVSIFVSFLFAILFALAQFCRSCQSFLCGISPHFVRSGDIPLFIYLYATKCSHVVSSSKREDPGNEKAVCLSPKKLPPVCFAAIICFIFVKCSWLV